MVFQVSRTFDNPSQGTQSGQPGIGAGAQTTGPASQPRSAAVPWDPMRPIKGLFSWMMPSRDGQRGFPSPEAPDQSRPPGSMPNVPPIFGGVYQNYTPYYDRGAAAFVPNFGFLLTNPIGAGVVALQRPQASYGPAGQYFNGAIWWTSQAIPTSVNLQGLTNPEVLASILSTNELQAVVRTTG